MSISDLFTHPQLIFRIVVKKKPGREFEFKYDTTSLADVGRLPVSRYSQQRELHPKESGPQAEIARFVFPTNAEGHTFFYDDYQHSINLRTNVTDGIAGSISEIYGRGIDEISMRGTFPKAGERSVILSTDWVPELKIYEPKDWVQSFKEFIQFFADLNDPYSMIWTDTAYNKIAFADNKEQSDFLYEFQIIDEYAEQIFAVMPRTPKVYGNLSGPLSYRWSIDFTVIEDKMQAPYKKIPDDSLDALASFKVPQITDLPVIGALSTTMNKMIAISNSVSKIMDTLSSYDIRPKFANDVMKLQAAHSRILTQAASIATKFT